jgi:hypothetical protein
MHFHLYWSAAGLNTAATIGTFFVILATAIAAGLELRHMAVKTQLQALMGILQDFRSPELQEALRYVQGYLDQKMHDPDYRDELARIGFIDARQHPEMTVCNWFNEMGTLIKNRIVDPDVFFDHFGRLINQYWKLLSPVIAILRRRRGPQQYQNFEFLAALAQQWTKEHPHGIFPKHVPHLDVQDVWLDADAVPPRVERV